MDATGGADAGGRPAAPSAPVRFRPDRTALAAVLMTLVGSVPLAGTTRLLAWLPLLPLAWGWWVLRARVVVSSAGLEVGNGLGRTRLAWARVQGYEVPPRGPVRVLTADGPRPLTAVPRARVRELVDASAVAGAPPA